MEGNDILKTDDAAARREARRRKILENSRSRLTRITGREHTEEDNKKTGNKTSIKAKEQNYSNKLNFSCRV